MKSLTIQKLLILGALALALSAIAAVFGLGFSVPSHTSPKAPGTAYRAIAADGWIQEGSSISFRGLASRGNYLDLTFDPWRPPGQAPAQLSASLCGKVVSTFTVSQPNQRERLYLTGQCNPRTVTFTVHNPFIPSEKDRRPLGAKIVRSDLGSPVGVPLVDLKVLAAATVLLWLLSILGAGLLGRLGLRESSAFGAIALIPFLAFLILKTVDDLELAKVFGLWVLFSCLLAGALIASLVRAAGAFSSESRAPVRAGIAVIVLIAAALRLYGLNFGLPNNYHPDEVPKLNAIMRMVEHGNLDPQYFLHPSFLLYSTYFVNSIFHALGLDFSWLGIPGDFRSTGFLAGRTVSAIAGTLSVYFVYCIGRRLFTPATGLVGAALLAVFPLHVTCSRYMKEDALLTCMVLATIVALLRAVKENDKRFLYLSGFLAGVAASSKYSGLLTVGIVASAPWLRSRRFAPDTSWIKATLLAVAIAPLGFLTFTPYAILNSEVFLKDFRSERNHMLRGHTIPVDAWSQYWMYHFWRSVIPGVSAFAAVAGIAGMGILLWRRRIEDLFVVGLILLFYLPAEWVKAKPEPQPERYIFPCLPFLALAAAELFRVLRESRIRALVPLLIAVTVAAPAIRTVQLASEVPDDTRTKMARWMIDNLPAGSKVYLDWKPYAPRFWNDEFQITHIPRAKILERLDVKALRESGFDYLVLSGLFYERYFTQPLAAPLLGGRIRQVFERVPVVKEFAPEYGTYGFHNPRLTLFSLKEEDFERLNQELAMKERGEIEKTSNEVRASFRW